MKADRGMVEKLTWKCYERQNVSPSGNRNPVVHPVAILLIESIPLAL
jgi:hypothetical protein